MLLFLGENNGMGNKWTNCITRNSLLGMTSVSGKYTVQRDLAFESRGVSPEGRAHAVLRPFGIADMTSKILAHATVPRLATYSSRWSVRRALKRTSEILGRVCFFF